MANGDITADDVGTALHPLFLALASSPSNAPFASLPQTMQIAAQQQRGGMSQSALKALLIQAGYTEAEATQYAVSEATAKLAIQQKQQQKLLGDGGDAEPSLFGGGGAPAISPAAPPGPAAGVSLNGSGTLTGDMGAFAGAIKAKESGGRYDIVGPTHPKYGRALGAYQVMESNLPQWSQEALGRTVTPEEFLKSPEIQDAIFAKKFGQSVEKYGNPQDAASVWFTGRPAAESANAKDSLGTTGANYVASFNSNLAKQRPVQVADASGATPVSRAPVAPSVQVANNEQEAQALERQMGMYPPNTYGVTAGAQAGAASPADMPAVDAQPAGFIIPPGAQAAVEKQIGAPPTPVNPNIGPTTQRAQAIANFNYWGRRLRASAAFGEAGKGLMEEAKIKMGLASEYLKPTDAEKLADAAGLTGATRSEILSGAIPGAAPTSLQKDYKSYRQQEIGEGRLPLSQIDYDTKLRTAGKTDINIRNDAEKKEEVGRAESVTKFLGGIADSAPATAKRAATLDQLGRLISRTATAQGTTLKAQLDGIGKELGLSSGELKTKADAINAIVNSLAPQMREPGTGTVSDADLRGFLAALPSLSATPEGNQLILGGLKRATDVDRERTKIAAQWQAGKLTAAEARSKIAEIDERSIYSSEAERSLVSGLNPIPENKARAGWRVLGVE